MMHKIFLLLLCVLFSFPAFAAPFKIGVLDIQRVTAETTFVNKAKDKLREKYSAEVEALKLERRALNEEVEKYNATSDKLKPDELTKWQQKINIQQVDINQRQIELQKKLISAENLETRQIINYFSNNVSKQAQKDNLDIVLFKDIVSYIKANGSIKDITNKIIKMSGPKLKAKSKKKQKPRRKK